MGGISRTVERDGWRFDIGGHRFFTKVQAVDDLWFEILGPEDFLQRPRMSRILYDGKLYDYPLVPMNALRNLGFRRGGPVHRLVRLGAGPAAEGPVELRGLHRGPLRVAALPHFFKTYTEKVWGVAATEIQADFGAQRVKDLSIIRAVIEAVHAQEAADQARQDEAGHEPDRGVQLPEVRPRQMWERCTEIVTERGRRSCSTRPVTGVRARERPGHRRHRGDRRRPDPLRVHRRHLVDADRRAARGDGPAAAARRARGRPRPDLPRLHHGRARRAAGVLASPTTGSTSTTPA